MPQRPSKKVKPQRGGKPGAAPDSERDQATQRRQSDATAKAVIGKFQGRKSI
jgi:hypothetical protein